GIDPGDPGLALDLLEIRAGPERVHVEIALPGRAAVALGRRQPGKRVAPAGGGLERPLLHDHHRRLARADRQLHPGRAVGLADHVDPGRDVRVQVDAVDEALADLLLEVPVVELATQRTFEHLLRAGLFEHRVQVAAQLQLRELLVATALARDADAPCPGRALDPVQALAHAHREARERADAGLVDDAVAV